MQKMSQVKCTDMLNHANICRLHCSKPKYYVRIFVTCNRTINLLRIYISILLEDNRFY